MTGSLIRIAFLLALAAIGLLRPAHAAAPQAMLKPAIIVDADKVTLGDLFDPSVFAAAPEAAHVPVLSAPRPGESLMLDALALQRFAARQQIDWPNTQGLTAVKIERAGTPVSTDAIEDALRKALEAQDIQTGIQGRLGLRLSSSPPALAVATGTVPSVSVEKLSADPATGQFRAVLRVPANDPAGAVAKVTGRAYAITLLPVLGRDVKPGETISARDIVLTEIPSERLGQNVLTADSDIVGRAPKRMIRAGEPLRLGDVEAPILVRRDTIVTMTMRAPGMTLTAEGRALENGAAGDIVKVMNTSSKRTVVATVEGEGLVSVGRPSPSPLAANFATPRP
jgi:flagellar basal body P-ring formation protein FlgA